MDGFAIIADGSRRRVLDRLLLGGPATVGQLVEDLALSQPNVSKHLRLLREAGWVRMEARGASRVYALSDTPPSDVERWLAPYRAHWQRHLDALESHLDTAAESRPTVETREVT